MKKTIEENGEEIIGSWTLNCVPFKASKFLGKLYVTNKSLYFDAQFDSSLSGLIGSVVTSAGAASGNALLVSSRIIKEWEGKGYMFVEKKNIKAIEEKSSFFKKTVVLELDDDSVIVFDYGMLGVKKLIEAIKVNS